MVNVAKYTIHGSYGNERIFQAHLLEIFPLMTSFECFKSKEHRTKAAPDAVTQQPQSECVTARPRFSDFMGKKERPYEKTLVDFIMGFLQGNDATIQWYRIKLYKIRSSFFPWINSTVFGCVFFHSSCWNIDHKDISKWRVFWLSGATHTGQWRYQNLKFRSDLDLKHKVSEFGYWISF